MSVEERLQVAGKASKKSKKKNKARLLREREMDYKLKMWKDIVSNVHGKRERKDGEEEDEDLARLEQR